MQWCGGRRGEEGLDRMTLDLWALIVLTCVRRRASPRSPKESGVSKNSSIHKERAYKDPPRWASQGRPNPWPTCPHSHYSPS